MFKAKADQFRLRNDSLRDRVFMVEPLERRQLLAADLAADLVDPVTSDTTAVDVAATSGIAEGTRAASFYTGRLRFVDTVDDVKRQRRDVVVNVTSADRDGVFAGTIAAAGLGNVRFNGELSGGRQFSADVTGDMTGTLYGEIRQGGNRFVASIVKEDQSRIGIAARAATPPGQTIVLPEDGIVGDELAAGTVAFTGLAGGRGTFRQAVDDPALVGPNFTPGRLRNDVALDITDQTSAGLLGGTLRVGETTFPVNGFTNNGQVTLLVLPEAGTVEDAQLAGVSNGVLRLGLNPFGTGFDGRFSRAGDGVLDVGRLSLTRTEPITMLPTASAGSIGGLLGAIEAGSFRGDPLGTPNTGIGAGVGSGIGDGIGIGAGSAIGSPISTGTEIGTASSVGSTRVSPIFSGTEIGTPRSTRSEVGTAVYTGSPALTGARGFGNPSPSPAGQLLDQTRSTGSLFG